MKDNKVFLSLIGLMFVSIIGVYVWTSNISKETTDKLADILATVNTHVQQAEIHANKKEYVSDKVFQIATDNIKEDLSEIKTDLKSLLAKGK